MLQFEENAHGGASALGQFVSGDTKGGGSMGSMGIGGGGGGREAIQQHNKLFLSFFDHS